MAKKRKFNPVVVAAAKQEPPSDEDPVSDPIAENPSDVDDQHPVKEEPPSDGEEDTQAPSDNDPDEAEEEENDDYSDDAEEGRGDPEALQKILELFPKDQLMDLLGDAAANHPDVLEQVISLADADPAHRKIFVHGLGWDTTAEVLADAFRPYGEIEDINAVTDKATGKSKGYGFILFKHRGAAKRALEEPQKKIGSRMTACQLASAGPVSAPAPAPAPAPALPPASEFTQKKIYVSNVGAEVDPQKVLQFFSKYGEIEEGPLGLDKVTGKPKGFCLFVYKTAESARKALEEPHKSFEGRILHCQRAIDGPKSNKLGFQLQQGNAQSFPRNDNTGIMIGQGSNVSAAAVQPSGLGFNQTAQNPPPAAAAVAGLNPALGQALTALLASQGAGMGLTNLLSALGSTGMGGQAANQAVPSPMMNNGAHGMNPGGMGGYGAMQGGYGNTPMGQGSTGRTRQGHGHMGGRPPYMGR